MENIYALHFTTSGKATISLAKIGSPSEVSLEYSYDGVDYSEWDLSGLTLNSGDALFIRGNNPRGFSSSPEAYYTFKIEGDKVSCSGNIMSLINYKKSIDIIPTGFCFYKLFFGCTALTTAPELPATKLRLYCYSYMFSGCTALTTAPELPATNLASAISCYNGMFSNCTSLVKAPELPATVLAKSCYHTMFSGCSSLKTAPKLPANSFEDSCYAYMFYGCSSLKTAPKLPKTALIDQYALRMFSGCTSFNAKQKRAMSLKEYCQIHLSSMLND